MSLNQTIQWIDKTEGRDKFCKAIQYLCRIMKYQTMNSNKELSQRFNGLFVGMRDARKLFRLFKSVNEYQKIVGLLNKGSLDMTELSLNVLTRMGFLLYWVFDNLAILAAIKFIKRDAKQYAKKGALFWLIALTLSLIQNIRSLVSNIHKAQYLQNKKTQDMKVQQDVKNLSNQQTSIVLNIIKNLGDMITASQGSEVFPKLTGKNFNEGWIGMGGFTSAVITSYQLY